MESKNLSEALDLEVCSWNTEAPTIREYFHALLKELWEQQEGFSGKRPFGDSGWNNDLYGPLIRAGFIPGTFDDDGYIEDFDSKIAHNIVSQLIDEAFKL